MQRSRHECRALAAGFVAVCALVGAAPAIAIPLPFAPLSGFDNSMGMSEDFVIESPSDWLPAGSPGSASSLALQVTELSQCLKTQSNPGGPCLTPLELFLTNEAFISDVTWQIEDQTGNGLPTLLWFTTINNTVPKPEYDRSDVKVDSDLATLDGQAVDLDVVRYTASIGAVVTDFFYLAVDLEEFGETGDDGLATFTFRYLVDEPLVIAGSPEFAINAAQDFTIVPEPSTIALLGIGLTAMALRSRTRASA